jgi:DNA-directed RNA polymerase specialized sigma24 family protein
MGLSPPSAGEEATGRAGSGAQACFRRPTLARLSLRDREVLLLVGVEGMSPSEAAGVCGLSSAALRARLHRAREKLASEMGESRAELRAKAG